MRAWRTPGVTRGRSAANESGGKEGDLHNPPQPHVPIYGGDAGGEPRVYVCKSVTCGRGRVTSPGAVGRRKGCWDGGAAVRLRAWNFPQNAVFWLNSPQSVAFC